MSENIKELIQKPNKDELDKRFLLKKFLKTVFRDVDFTKEDIRLLDVKKEHSKPYFYNDIDSIINRTFSNKHCWNNQHFQLQTVSKGCNKGTADVREYAYCIAFDFDNHAKEIEQRGKITIKDIVNKFIDTKIFCHCIVDTGNGYHAYVMINKTTDFDKVQAVHKALCSRLGADINAIKPTQVLRIPYSMNVKDFPKEVKIVHLEPYNSTLFRAYDIDFLYKMNVEKQLEEVRTLENTDNITSKYVLNSCNIPHCIAEKIENGSEEGDRYFDLCNIVVALRGCNKPLSQIKEVVKEWSLKSNNYNEGLSKIDYIYKNKQHLELSCSNCKSKSNCFNIVIADFNFDESYPVNIFENKVLKNTKKGKGKSVMTNNEFFIYTVLKNNKEGLYRSEIEQLITIKKKKKCRLSRPTLLKALEGLSDKGYVTVEKCNSKTGDFYKLVRLRCKIEETVQVSYLATVMCIFDNISTEELKFYHFLRYLHAEQQRDNTKTLKGSLFQMNQKIIAEKYGVEQGTISKLISGLLEAHLLDIYYRETSKNNGYEYNVYKLNC